MNTITLCIITISYIVYLCGCFCTGSILASVFNKVINKVKSNPESCIKGILMIISIIAVIICAFICYKYTVRSVNSSLNEVIYLIESLE